MTTALGPLLDELEAVEWVKRRPYGSRISAALNDYLRVSGQPAAELMRLLHWHVGSDEQAAALAAYHESIVDEALSDYDEVHSTEAWLAHLISLMSGDQRAKLAVAVTYMPWGLW